jgi:hypothetical protein
MFGGKGCATIVYVTVEPVCPPGCIITSRVEPTATVSESGATGVGTSAVGWGDGSGGFDVCPLLVTDGWLVGAWLLTEGGIPGSDVDVEDASVDAGAAGEPDAGRRPARWCFAA